MNSIQVFKPDIQKEIGNLDPITDAEQICTLRWVKKHALSVITEEEILNEGSKRQDEFFGCQHCSSFELGWEACWKYILSRINQ